MDSKKSFFTDLEDLAGLKGDFGLGIGQFGAVQLDPSLGDESARFRIAGNGFGFLDKFSDGEGGGGGAKRFHLGRSQIFFGEFGFEVGSGGGGCALPVEATNSGGGQLLLGFHRVRG